jgi:hypothetical protein
MKEEEIASVGVTRSLASAVRMMSVEARSLYLELVVMYSLAPKGDVLLPPMAVVGTPAWNEILGLGLLGPSGDGIDLKHVSREQGVRKSKTTTVSARVMKVWEACSWRRVGKAKALSAIETAGKKVAREMFSGDPDAAAQYLADRAKAYSESLYVRTCPKFYLPHPATWFAQGRYEDSPAEWNRAHSNRDAPSTAYIPSETGGSSTW